MLDVLIFSLVAVLAICVVTAPFLNHRQEARSPKIVLYLYLPLADLGMTSLVETLWLSFDDLFTMTSRQVIQVAFVVRFTHDSFVLAFSSVHV